MRVKKGLASVEVESDLDKELYHDIKSKINENDKTVVRYVAENPNSSTTEIAEGTGLPRTKVDYSLTKLDSEDAVRYSRKKGIKRWFVDNKEVVAIVLGISLVALALLMSKSLLSVGEFKPTAEMEGSPEAVQSQGILSPVVTAKGKGAGAGSLLGIGGSPKEMTVGEGGAGAQGFISKAEPVSFGEQTIEGSDIDTGAGGTTIYQPIQEEYYRKSQGILSPSLGDIETGGQEMTIIGDENIGQQQEAITQAGYISTQKAIQEAVEGQELTPEQLAYLKAQGVI